MFFWIILSLFIFFAITYIPCQIFYTKVNTIKNDLNWSDWDKWRTKHPKKIKVYRILDKAPGIILTVFFWIFLICLVICLLVFIFVYPTAEADQAKLIAEAEVLQYQVDNEFYDNVIENGRSTLFDKVNHFNKDIIFNRTFSKNFWFGIFVPDIYDDVPLIVLPERGQN